jgi:hypothetical protein
VIQKPQERGAPGTLGAVMPKLIQKRKILTYNQVFEFLPIYK